MSSSSATVTDREPRPGGPELPADRLVPVPAEGRVLTTARKVRWGEVSMSGHARLDALGAFMADLASDDHALLGLGGEFPWVVLRVAFEIGRPAVFLEDVTLHTWCSALGLRWAERRVSMTGVHGASIEGAILWVAFDVEAGTSVRVPSVYKAECGPAALGRTVTSTLQHPPVVPDPGPGTRRTIVPWAVRAIDFDPFGHVNNASAWAMVEELLPERPHLRGQVRHEMEYHRPVEPGHVLSLVVDDEVDGSLRAWAVGAAGDRSPGAVYFSTRAARLA